MQTVTEIVDELIVMLDEDADVERFWACAQRLKQARARQRGLDHIEQMEAAMHKASNNALSGGVLSNNELTVLGEYVRAEIQLAIAKFEQYIRQMGALDKGCQNAARTRSV